MKGRAMVLLLGLTAVLSSAPMANADDEAAGTWEGPWYRGMTSGKVKIDLNAKPGTIQFTNLDNFGTQPHPVDANVENGALKFRTEGEKGGPLTASLKLNEARTEAKGLGKFDGFPLRFELKRGN
jgi:hypothetical protein